MATHKTLTFLLLSAILLSVATSALSYQKEKREDPERRLQECRQKCQQEERGEQERCETWCEEQYRKQQQQRQEQEKPGQERNHHQREQEQEDPERRLQECRQRCRQEQRGEQEQQKECETRCEERFRQQQQEQEERRGHGGNPREQEEQGENPYFFGRDRFRDLVSTEHGAVRILQKFQERSRFLFGLANYRIAFLEANPRAFVVPHHSDVDAVFFVTRGRAVISLKHGQDWETHEIRQGDLIRVRSGTIVHLANNDINEKLYVVKFLRSVSNPGEVEAFNDAGGKNSYFRAFSREVLEAAFNNKWERIEKLFGEKTQETIVRASDEQIRSMSRRSEQGGRWTPFGRGEQSRSRPFNLLKKRPSHANDRGQLFEADARDYEELRDIDLRVAVANIKQGSMTGPFFETRSTKVTVVLGGKGIVEMSCPQRSRQQQLQQQQEREEGLEQEQHREQEREQKESEQGEERYQKVRSELSIGNVFVSPPGNPTVFINSGNENLQLLCFEVNAENNQRIFLTGRNSPLRKFEKEVIQLSFGADEREAREVLDSQKEEIFFQGPRQASRGQPLSSILEAAMF